MNALNPNPEQWVRHGKVFKVNGFSMWPLYPTGTSIEIDLVNSEDLKPGDVVVVGKEGRYYVHRFITWNAGGLIQTAGDTRLRPDPFVDPERLMGRVRAFRGTFKHLLNQAISFVTVLRFRMLNKVLLSCRASHSETRDPGMGFPPSRK